MFLILYTEVKMKHKYRVVHLALNKHITGTGKDLLACEFIHPNPIIFFSQTSKNDVYIYINQQHQSQIRVVEGEQNDEEERVTWDAESLILSPGRTPGSAATACSCCVEKSDDEPASEMGAAATAPWWRSDLLRMSLASILSILDALWPS